MKTVVAIIKPFRVPAVVKALGALPHGPVMATEVRGYGRQKGHLDAYEGSEVAIEFIPKIRLEFQVDDLFAAQAVRELREAARTGRIGDGKVFLFSQAELGLESPADGEAV